MKYKEVNTEDSLTVKDDVSSCEAKQPCVDGEAVAMETVSSADGETRADGNGCDDSESDEMEDGELVSSSSESEVEPEETVREKGKGLSVSVLVGICLAAQHCAVCSG